MNDNIDLSLPPQRKLKNDPVSDEQAEAWGKARLDKMRQICEKLVALLPEGYRDFVIEDGETVVTGEHGFTTGRLPTSVTISFLGGAVTIHPEAVKNNCIGGYREHPGWHVTVWQFHSATRQEPEDCSDSEVCQTMNDYAAVEAAVKVIFNDALSVASENMGIQDQVDEPWPDEAILGGMG